MLEIFPYNLQTDTSLGQPMQTLELARVAGVCFFVGVCFVCVSWSKRYSRAKSEPSSNGKTKGGGGGREKELSFAPSLIGFSFDIFIYKTLTKNTKKLIATRAMLDSIRWIRSSKGQLVMIPSYRELALCPSKLEKPDRKNADRTKWRERFLCGHYCVYMLWLIFYFG